MERRGGVRAGAVVGGERSVLCRVRSWLALAPAPPIAAAPSALAKARCGPRGLVEAVVQHEAGMSHSGDGGR